MWVLEFLKVAVTTVNQNVRHAREYGARLRGLSILILFLASRRDLECIEQALRRSAKDERRADDDKHGGSPNNVSVGANDLVCEGDGNGATQAGEQQTICWVKGTFGRSIEKKFDSPIIGKR